MLLFTCAGVLRQSRELSVGWRIVEAARLRPRPIPMVSDAILIGLIPLALTLEAEGDMLQPMAIAAICALSMEAPVALVLMPVLQALSNREARAQQLPEAARTARAPAGATIVKCDI